MPMARYLQLIMQIEFLVKTAEVVAALAAEAVDEAKAAEAKPQQTVLVEISAKSAVRQIMMHYNIGIGLIRLIKQRTPSSK
jgi:ribosomal protein S19E (S16A)